MGDHQRPGGDAHAQAHLRGAAGPNPERIDRELERDRAPRAPRGQGLGRRGLPATTDRRALPPRPPASRARAACAARSPAKARAVRRDKLQVAGLSRDPGQAPEQRHHGGVGRGEPAVVGVATPHRPKRPVLGGLEEAARRTREARGRLVGELPGRVAPSRAAGGLVEIEQAQGEKGVVLEKRRAVGGSPSTHRARERGAPRRGRRRSAAAAAASRSVGRPSTLPAPREGRQGQAVRVGEDPRDRARDPRPGRARSPPRDRQGRSASQMGEALRGLRIGRLPRGRVGPEERAQEKRVVGERLLGLGRRPVLGRGLAKEAAAARIAQPAARIASRVAVAMPSAALSDGPLVFLEQEEKRAVRHAPRGAGRSRRGVDRRPRAGRPGAGREAAEKPGQGRRRGLGLAQRGGQEPRASLRRRRGCPPIRRRDGPGMAAGLDPEPCPPGRAPCRRGRAGRAWSRPPR